MLATLAVTLLALAPTACGDDGQQAPEVPDGAVAVVGDAQISEQDLARQVAAVRRAQSEPPEQQDTPEGAGDAKRRLQEQALSMLLIKRALEQEAAERDIEVERATARQRWRAVADNQFATRKELRRFLGDQTEQDVVDQLRLQMLAEAIHAQVAEEAGGGARGKRAVRRFQADFRKQWQSRTACRAGVDGAGCPAPESR